MKFAVCPMGSKDRSRLYVSPFYTAKVTILRGRNVGRLLNNLSSLQGLRVKISARTHMYRVLDCIASYFGSSKTLILG